MKDPLDARVAKLEKQGFRTRLRRTDLAALERGDTELVVVLASGRVVRIDPRDPYLALLLSSAEAAS